MSKPEATVTNQKPVTVEDLSQVLESIADSLATIDSRQEKLETAVDDLKSDTEEILNNLDSISFKADYPGLEVE